jgi:hypothetical protein
VFAEAESVVIEDGNFNDLLAAGAFVPDPNGRAWQGKARIMPVVEMSERRIVYQQKFFRVLWVSALFIVAGLSFTVLVGVISLTMKPVGGESSGGVLFAMVFTLSFASLGVMLFLFCPYAYTETLDQALQELTLERHRVVGTRIRRIPFGDITEVTVKLEEGNDDHDAYLVCICRSTGEQFAVGDRDCADKVKQEEAAWVLRSFLRSAPVIPSSPSAKKSIRRDHGE